LKVGAADGATDVTQVIAAVDWVTQHAHDPGMNIRVLNLSYGTASTQAYTSDSLAQAVEQAWKHGIVVVAAAGNDGKSSKNLADPAFDPYVIAVGGDDPNATLATGDDTVPTFAEHGNSKRPVDVTAPATHVLGLRVPGSFIDTMTTNTGRVGTRIQRGSGTSEAAAVTSGGAALIAQKYPIATPDQIKAQLTTTATKLANGNANAPGQLVHWGHGIVDVAAAVAAPLTSTSQIWTTSTGTGTLDGARAGVYVVDNGVSLTGEKDIFGQAFNAATMAAAQTSATAWPGGIWNGSRWSGNTWSGSDWSGSRWSGSRWSGMTWDGSRWSGSGWAGSRWTGSAWDGSRWSSATWA